MIQSPHTMLGNVLLMPLQLLVCSEHVPLRRDSRSKAAPQKVPGPRRYNVLSQQVPDLFHAAGRPPVIPDQTAVQPNKGRTQAYKPQV